MIPSRLSLVLTGTAFVALELWHSFLVPSLTYPSQAGVFLTDPQNKIQCSLIFFCLQCDIVLFFKCRDL
jgi:hypothetical protein